MAKSTKSYEERMLEMEKKEQESLEKAKRYAAQKKELLKRKKAEESKKRTHRLCQVGGAVESVLGATIEEEDIPKLIGFLKKQEANGKFFSKAMQKETNTDMEEVNGDFMDRVMATDAERYNAGTVRYPVTDGVMEVEIAANGAMIFIGSKGE